MRRVNRRKDLRGPLDRLHMEEKGKGLMGQAYSKGMKTSEGLTGPMTLVELSSGITWGQILEENQYWAKDCEM